MYIGYVGWSGVQQLLAPTQEQTATGWDVVSVQWRTTQQNDVYTAYAWKVVVRNNSSTPGNFIGEVRFLDKDDFEVATDGVNMDGVLIGANTEGTFTGLYSVASESASGVVKVVASVRKR
jgi:hypothetical protein